MPPAEQATFAGSLRMFRLWGISVYVHWSWLLVAYFSLQVRVNLYDSQVWNVVEYLTLFGIVLVHEFGHSLACRQVGGLANEIVLWPLGGVAFVSPPARPGAWLWSIAAGPLVNVVLVPVTIGVFLFAGAQGWAAANPDLDRYLGTVVAMNILLLLFNMLPVYPLDGGQILQALLWFVIGRANSLYVVSVIGMIAAAAVVMLAAASFLDIIGQVGPIDFGDVWFLILALFVALRSWAGFQQARFLAKLAEAPRHDDAACPSCGVHPFAGELWGCGQCGARFDTFAQRGVCPNCSQRFEQTACPECYKSHPMKEWIAAAARRRDDFETQ